MCQWAQRMHQDHKAPRNPTSLQEKKGGLDVSELHSEQEVRSSLRFGQILLPSEARVDSSCVSRPQVWELMRDASRDLVECWAGEAQCWASSRSSGPVECFGRFGDAPWRV